MSLKGGYQILNLEGYSFVDESEPTNNIEGISDFIKLAYQNKKAILISGLEFEGVVQPDMVALSINASSRYGCFIYTRNFEISIFHETHTIGDYTYKKDDVIVVLY